MTTEAAFYITCLAMMLIGALLCVASLLVSKASENVAAYVAMLGVLCFAMGPFMAVAGPR